MLFSRGGFYRRKSSFSLESVVVSFVLAGMRSLLPELVLSSNPFALREHQSNARLLPVLGDLVDRKVLLMHEFTETLGRVERRSFCTSSRRITTRAVLRGKNLSPRRAKGLDDSTSSVSSKRMPARTNETTTDSREKLDFLR